jgi:hypothetical protein
LAGAFALALGHDEGGIMFGVTVALTTIGVLAHFEGHTTGVLAGCEELKR